jgi:hypothetical protein
MDVTSPNNKTMMLLLLLLLLGSPSLWLLPSCPQDKSCNKFGWPHLQCHFKLVSHLYVFLGSLLILVHVRLSNLDTKKISIDITPNWIFKGKTLRMRSKLLQKCCNLIA